MPHRSTAIWIDSVIAYGEDGGECRVRLDTRANYASAGQVRATSYVEWVAQAYGYSIAAWTHSRGGAPEVRRAFLVSISNLTLSDGAARFAILEAEELVIRARRTHQLGPISVVSGEVSTLIGRKLAEMRLKVFAEITPAHLNREISRGSSPD